MNLSQAHIQVQRFVIIVAHCCMAYTIKGLSVQVNTTLHEKIHLIPGATTNTTIFTHNHKIRCRIVSLYTLTVNNNIQAIVPTPKL